MEVLQIKKVRFEKAGTLPKFGLVPPLKLCLEVSAWTPTFKNNISLFSSIQTQICKHLDLLENSFGDYFDFTYFRTEIWLNNPFLVDLNIIDNSDLVKDELIHLGPKEMAHYNFRTKDLIEFFFRCRRLIHELYPGQWHIWFHLPINIFAKLDFLQWPQLKRNQEIDQTSKTICELSNMVPDLKSICKQNKSKFHIELHTFLLHNLVMY